MFYQRYRLTVIELPYARTTFRLSTINYYWYSSRYGISNCLLKLFTGIRSVCSLYRRSIRALVHIVVFRVLDSLRRIDSIQSYRRSTVHVRPSARHVPFGCNCRRSSKNGRGRRQHTENVQILRYLGRRKGKYRRGKSHSKQFDMYLTH